MMPDAACAMMSNPFRFWYGPTSPNAVLEQEHELRINRGERRVVDAELRRHARDEVLDDHVYPWDEFVKRISRPSGRRRSTARLSLPRLNASDIRVLRR